MIIVVTILSILIIALSALPWWTRSWEKVLVDLKRQPDTLGAVLGYICDSTHLLAMFEGQNFTNLSDLKAFRKNSGARFRIGEFRGEDGGLYYGIEVADKTQWVDTASEEAVQLTPQDALPEAPASLVQNEGNEIAPTSRNSAAESLV